MIYNYRTKMLTQTPFKTASVLKSCFLSDLQDHTDVRIETNLITTNIVIFITLIIIP